MAYIPPHKRHSEDTERPTPTPYLLERRNDERTLQRGNNIYAKGAKPIWHPVGLTDDNQFPPSVCLEPISLEFIERTTGEQPLTLPLTLVNSQLTEARGKFLESPWVAEKLLQPLLSSSQSVRKEMDNEELEEVKPSLAAKFGKIIFRGSPSVSLDETSLRKLKGPFYTNVAATYMENIVCGVVPKIGVDFAEEKELYHVKLSDSLRPGTTVSCKCRVRKDDKMLELYKIEVKPLRHLVVDISCLDKNLDLRLMLSTKRILTALTDNESDSIRDLVNSAVVDPDVKGGLKWPPKKESSGDRYSVTGAWHTKAKAYKNSSLRLKVRDADFGTSTGEVTREVTLKMTGLVSQLKEQPVEIESFSVMLEDTLKLIWEHFLSGDSFLT